MTDDSSPDPILPSAPTSAEPQADDLAAPVSAPPQNWGGANADAADAPACDLVAAEVPPPVAAARSADSAPAESDEPLPPRRFFPLDPRSVRAEQLSGLIFFLCFFVACCVGLGISFVAIDEMIWIWWGIAATVACGASLLLGFVLVWPGIEFRHAQWTWDDNGLEIHRGVFWRHRITIPISRIQHVDVSQGPLQRQFGLGKVTVHTAGTQLAAIELSGIAYEAAIWLREQIIAGQGAPDAV